MPSDGRTYIHIHIYAFRNFLQTPLKNSAFQQRHATTRSTPTVSGGLVSPLSPSLIATMQWRLAYSSLMGSSQDRFVCELRIQAALRACFTFTCLA